MQLTYEEIKVLISVIFEQLMLVEKEEHDHVKDRYIAYLKKLSSKLEKGLDELNQ